MINLGFPAIVGLLILCLLVAHFARRRGETGWMLLAIGFAAYLVYPGWIYAAYKAISGLLVAPSGSGPLLGALIMLAVAFIGCKMIFFGHKR